MADTISHRGPDDEGYYVSGAVGFGFRRLAIIDLNSGHQPISNEDGSVWIVFNGEIYNYQELKCQLEAKGHVFRTRTDTEVIVHLYEEFGEDCVKKLRGMFAFAIWDDKKRILLLARDRVGIKPLYYSLDTNRLVFASEIKAILADPEVSREIAPEVIDRFLTYYFVPGEETMLRNIHKLAPGHYMIIRDGRAQIRQFWDLQFSQTTINLKQAEEELVSLLEESVRMHMISDVPVGFLLSGGVDSTAMLDFAAGKTNHALSSFTLGFSAPDVADERPYAQIAARKYGTRHFETTISAREFADFLPSFAWHMEEPVCEPQAIALYYVSKLAKDHVKVLISGEGGDEAFAGYQTYRGILWLERLKMLTSPFNLRLASTLTELNRLFSSQRLQKYPPLLTLPFEDYYYSRTATPFCYFNARRDQLYSQDFAATVDKVFSLQATKRYLDKNTDSHIINRMLYVDTKTSLPDDLLLKADKMTMANSIELRVPFLDHKILEFAASLPENFKVRGFTTKYIAKQALRKRVPKAILQRKKAGFPVPYGRWLRTELNAWVRDLLLDKKTMSRGYFNPQIVERMLAEDSATGCHSRDILSLVALELWHRAFVDSKGFESNATSESLSVLTPIHSTGRTAIIAS